MKDILSSLAHILKVNSNLEEEIAIASEKNKAEIIDLNVSQLDESILSTGKKITPKYSANYAKFKGFKNPDLNLEGDFRSGIFIERRFDYLVFDSTDYKADKLEEKYSSDIFGIAPKNEQKYYDEIDEDLLNIIDKKYSNGIR